MSATGRTTWRAKPCGWRDRERVVALGEEFGPGGPLVLDVLEEMAKEQIGDGTVRAGLRSLARAAFLPRGSEGAEMVRAILTFAATVGALDDLVIADDADMTVTCRVSGFVTDQGKGYESVRKARQRAVADEPPVELEEDPAPAQGDDVPNAGTDRDTVPKCPPTGQDRTEQTSSLRSEDARGGEQEDQLPKIKHAGKPVSAARHQLALDVLASFNQQMGTGHGAYKANGQPSASLSRILTFLAEAAEPVTLDIAIRMITAAGRDPYWKPAAPTTGNVFSGQAAEKNLETARRALRHNTAALSDGDRHVLASQQRTEMAERQFEREFAGGARAA